MKKLLLLFLLGTSCGSTSQVTTRVLAKGVIYNWQICEMTQAKTKLIYFNFKFVNAGADTRSATKINYGYVGFLGPEEKPELLDFVAYLREAALSNTYTNTGIRYNMSSTIDSVFVYDWNGAYIKLTKPNAKALATDIEKSINLLQ